MVQQCGLYISSNWNSWARTWVFWGFWVFCLFKNASIYFLLKTSWKENQRKPSFKLDFSHLSAYPVDTADTAYATIILLYIEVRYFFQCNGRELNIIVFRKMNWSNASTFSKVNYVYIAIYIHNMKYRHVQIMMMIIIIIKEL